MAANSKSAEERLRAAGWRAVEGALWVEAALRYARRGLPGAGTPARQSRAARPGSPAAATLERLLTDNLLAFWDERIIDRERGGYALAHDRSGQPTGDARRHLVTQARTVWFFSRLSRTRWARPAHLEWAEHGYRFLLDHMRDQLHGGFHWSVVPGAARDERKHLYGQTAVLQALVEYAHASGDLSAADAAGELFELLDSHAHDERHGGYHESLRGAWEREPPGREGALGAATELKTLNAHMHLMSAFTSLARLRPSAVVRERLAELIVVLSTGSLVAGGRTFPLERRRDWTAVRPLRSSYGHDLETVWMLMDACAALGVSDGPLLPVFTATWDHALENGFDHERGGFYSEGGIRLPAHHRFKEWWVQAECLLSALRMHRRTGEPRYLSAFESTLEWIVDEQVDWGRGGWHREVSRRGIRRGVKAGPWQDAFHEGRALIECLETLDPRRRPVAGEALP
jgi:mannobiose 2-epimerase